MVDDSKSNSNVPKRPRRSADFNPMAVQALVLDESSSAADISAFIAPNKIIVPGMKRKRNIVIKSNFFVWDSLLCEHVKIGPQAAVPVS